MGNTKQYSFKEATKSKTYSGLDKKTKRVKEATKGIYKGVKDEDGLEALNEAGEFSIVRKFLLKDMMRNHRFPMSRAKFVVGGLEKIYGTMISAQTVSNSLLNQVVKKIEVFDDRVQKMVTHRGGETESEDVGDI